MIDKHKKSEYWKIYYNKNKTDLYLKNLQWAREHPEPSRKRARIWALNNPEKRRVYAQEYRKRHPGYIQQYFDSHPGKRTALAAKRKAQKLLATPPWSKLDMIEVMYSNAKIITEVTGIQHDVDHIIPLQGKGVSGLHVDYNLQIIPAVENLRKGNKYSKHAVMATGQLS
jgi:5-methylcytosine-specific restriction endonuclease McrA